MTPDLRQLAADLANAYRSEEAIDRLHANTLSWHASITVQRQIIGVDLIANPERPELHETFAILDSAEQACIDELCELEDRYRRIDQIKAAITEIAATLNLTLADLEEPGEHGHA